MSRSSASMGRRPFRPATLVLLGVAGALLGYLSGFPAGLGAFVVVAGVVASAGLRWSSPPRVAAYAPVPALAVLVVEALSAPVGLGSELVAGFAGLAYLFWLADDPSRPAGGPARALPTVAVPALALGIAWSSAFFLRSGAVPLGVAGALLALVLAAVAFLVGRPRVFDREEA